MMERSARKRVFAPPLISLPEAATSPRMFS